MCVSQVRSTSLRPTSYVLRPTSYVYFPHPTPTSHVLRPTSYTPHRYVKLHFPKEQQKVIFQALHLRSLLILIDGIDEAAAQKTVVEDYIFSELVPKGQVRG